MRDRICLEFASGHHISPHILHAAPNSSSICGMRACRAFVCPAHSRRPLPRLPWALTRTLVANGKSLLLMRHRTDRCDLVVIHVHRHGQGTRHFRRLRAPCPAPACLSGSDERIEKSEVDVKNREVCV